MRRIISTITSFALFLSILVIIPVFVTAPKANALTTGTGSGLFALIKNGVSDYTTTPTDMKFSDRCGSTILTTVDFDWSTTMPAGASSCGTQDGSWRVNYSAMITGYLLAPATGSFTFKSRNDDGFIVNINGQTVISSWTGQGAQALPNFNTNNASSATMSLVEGNIYPIRIFFSQGAGNGEAHLYWNYGSGDQIIPQSNLGLTASDLGTGCAVGESQYCPADNARQIKALNGTTSNQKWWINVGGVSTNTYALMDSNIDGGGWMLGMKGLTNAQSNSTALGYDATQWTTTTTLQAGSDNNAPLASDNANGKNNVFNYTAATEALVIWRDLLNRSDGFRYTGAGSYGFTWKESLTSSTGWSNSATNGVNSSGGCPTTAVTLLVLFTNANRCKIRAATSAPIYDARGSTVFSSQNQIDFFGFNYYGSGATPYKKVRFGFGWNENEVGNESSGDVNGGIGMGGTIGGYGAGDYIGCCQSTTGINRQAGFEFYVRNSALGLSGSTTSATVTYGTAGTPWTASSPGYSAGAQLQRYIIKPIGSGVDMSKISINASTGAVSTTSDIAGGTYNLAVSMIDTYGQVASSKFTLTVKDAGLTALTLTTGTLSPVFSKETTSYTATVPHATTSISVTPTGALSSSTYQTNVNSAGYTTAFWTGSQSLSLALDHGTNTILILVTATDGTTTRLYTLTVTREIPVCSPTSSSLDGFTTLTFSTTGSCTWSTPAGLTTAQLLVVGGGGGGGDSSTSATGGGGGAGGYFSSSSVAVSGSILITVGAGGSGATSSTTNGTSGRDSAFGTLKVGGGGYGNSVSFATSQRAGSGIGGSGYVSGGSGGGGRSRNAGDNNAKLAGTAGARDASGVSFLGTTYTGLDGTAGNDAWSGDYLSGGFGGAITSSSRTSSISGSSTVYSKGGTFLPWNSGSNTAAPQTYGSGGAANYNYGNAEAAGNTLGGDGAQGVVILKYAMPSAPTSLVATPGNGQVSIAFDSGVNIGAGITNYKYSLDGTNFTAFSPAVTTSPVVVTGLTNGTSYTIYLKAVNATGDSAASSSVTSTPRTVPSAPTNLVATVASGQVSIAFNAGATGGSAITNYKYSLDGTNYNAFSPVDAATPVVITGLTNGTTYTIYLKAVNIAGDGTASASITATPNVVPTVSSAPTISGTTTRGQILTASTGTWANNPTSYSYTWSRATTSAGAYSTISGATTSTYTLAPADIGNFIKVSVTATNSAGNSTASTSAATAAAVIAADPIILLDSGTSTSYSGSGSTWNDISGNGYGMTLYNSPSYSATNSGIINFSAASSQYGQTATSLPALSTFSAQVWFKLSAYPTGERAALVTSPYTSGGQILGPTIYVTSAGKLDAGFFDGAYWRTAFNNLNTSPATGTSPLTLNAWYNAVVTWNGTNIKLYLNNSLVATSNNLSSVSSARSAPLRVGVRWDAENNTAYYIPGSIPVVIVNNTALSASEISTSFNTYAPRYLVPANTVLPAISGTQSVGQVLSVTNGTWDNTPSSYTYTWARSTTLNGTYTAISNATSSTYTVTSSDVGYFVRANVTAVNTAGQLEASSVGVVITGAALTPTFGAATRTVDGFTVQISNYSADYAWAGTATSSGVVSINSSGLVTVTGVAPGVSSTATITTTRSNYTGGSAPVTATSLQSTVATLSALTLQTATLSPTFTSGTTSYTATVSNDTSSITVTPTKIQANATITVNGTAVTSGSASGSISLTVGSNTITVVVTAQDGTTTQTYTVTVTRAASTVSTLSALVLTTATLSPTFASGTTSYTSTVSNATTSLTVTATKTQAKASITVNGASATSGSATPAISLNVGSNIITIVVTAEDASTTSTYTVTVTRQSNDATLSGLVLSAGTLSPTFSASTTSYTASVKNSVTSITITPTKSESNSTVVQYLGATGTTAFSGPISLGANVIRIVVTAQDGTVKTYTVTVTKAPEINFINTLSAPTGLALTAYLGITFQAATGGSGTFTYTYSINDTVNAALPSGLTFNGSSRSITGTPTVAATTGTIKIIATDTNGDVFTMGQGFSITILASSQLPLTITTMVGTATQSLVLRTAGGSGDGSISFTYRSGANTTCSLSGITMTATTTTSGALGICYVTATKAAFGAYNAVSSAETTIYFTPYVPVITQSATCPAGTAPSAPTGIGVTGCQPIAPTSAASGSTSAAPKITSLSATTGIAGTTSIVITGSGFATVTKVQFGSKSTTTFTLAGDNTTITVIVPIGATRGRVMVASPSGSAVSLDIFTPTSSDTRAPAYLSGNVNTSTPTQINLNFDESLAASGLDKSAFGVSVASATATIASISISGTSVTLTLSAAVSSGQAVLFTYTSPGDATSLQDAAGNRSATITATSISNTL